LTLTSVLAASGAIDQLAQHTLAPHLSRVEGDRVGLAAPGIALAHRYRANAGVRAFHRRGNRARIADILREIGATVDAAQDQVGLGVLHDFGQRG
jgi:hypothetical protein